MLTEYEINKTISINYYLTFEVNLLIEFFKKRVAMFEDLYNNIDHDISCGNIAFHINALWRDRDRLNMEISFLTDLSRKDDFLENIINRYISDLTDINNQLKSIDDKITDLYDKRLVIEENNNKNDEYDDSDF